MLKSFWLRLCFCCSLLLYFPLLQAGIGFHVPIEYWETKNGMPVYFVARPQLPFVDISMGFHAGSAYDNKKPGLANLTNSLLNQGTINFNADLLAKRFDEVGALFFNATTRDEANLTLRSLTDPTKLSLAIETFTDIITHPNFPISAFTREKNRLLNIVKANQDDPSLVATERYYQSLYGSLPYGHLPIGNQQSLEAIFQGDVIHFYREYYTAHNGFIVIVGNLSREQAEVIANKLSHQLSLGKLHKVSFALPVQTAQTLHVDFKSLQNNIRIGQIGVAQTNKDYFPLQVGNFILGGDTLSSLLGKTIREKLGFTYGINSTFTFLEEPGPFTISFSTRNKQAKRAIQESKTLLKSYLQTGPTDKQLAFAKRYLTGSFPVKLDDNTSILAVVTRIASLKLPLDYLDSYIDNINRVTIEAVKIALQRHISLDKLTTVIVGPAPAEAKANG